MAQNTWLYIKSRAVKSYKGQPLPTTSDMTSCKHFLVCTENYKEILPGLKFWKHLSAPLVTTWTGTAPEFWKGEKGENDIGY